MNYNYKINLNSMLMALSKNRTFASFDLNANNNNNNKSLNINYSSLSLNYYADMILLRGGEFLDSNINNNEQMYKKWSDIFFLFVYILIFFIGLFGNFIVIYFVIVYKRMQTMTNKFITNLAVADLLVIFICIPVTASRHLTKQWLFGEFMCRFSNFAQGVSLSVSVMTLTAISIDRYYIIYKPMKARSVCTNRKVKLILIATWILSVFIMSPLLIVFKFERREIENITFSMCFEKWPEFEAKLCYEVLLICALFCFPVIFMSYAYFTISKTLWFVEQKENLNKAFIHPLKLVNSVVHVSAAATAAESRQQQKHVTFKKNKNESKMIKIDLRKTNNKNKKSILCKTKLECDMNQIAKEQQQLKNIVLKEEDINKIDIEKLEAIENESDKEMEYSLLDASSIENNINTNGAIMAQMPLTKKTKNKYYLCLASKININLQNKKKKNDKIMRKYSNTRALNSLVYQLKIYNSKGSLTNNNNNNNKNNQRNTSISYQTSKTQLFKTRGNQIAIHKLIRSRRRVVKLLIILVFLFLISWLPYHFISLLIDCILYWDQKSKDNNYNSNNNTTTNQSFENKETSTGETVSSMFSTYVYPLALCLALANSATNPVCYITLSHGFRNMFKTTFRKFVKIR